MIRTDNFSPEGDPKLLCTCGHPLCDKRSVGQFTLDRVQLIREDANRGLTVTSGGRCPHHPNEVDRTTPADHQQGIGIDLSVRGGVERMELVSLGLKYGANAIGVARTFVHLGWRDTSRSVIWTY